MNNIKFERKSDPISIIIAKKLSPLPHFHRELELVYIMDGGCSAYIDGKMYTLEKGDVFISFPGQIHYYMSSLEGKYYICLLNPDVLYSMNEILDSSVLSANVIKKDMAYNIAELLEKTLECKGEFKRTLIAGVLNQAVAEALSKVELIRKNKSDSTAFQGIIKYCSHNFTEDITLDVISKNLHVSKFHISHLINEKIGMSFNLYINMLRVDKARTLLSDTGKKIADISEEVGFGSIRSFNRAFVNITGLTPKQYREKKRGQLSN